MLKVSARVFVRNTPLSTRLSELAWAALGHHCAETGQNPTVAVNTLIETHLADKLPKSMRGLAPYRDRFMKGFDGKHAA